MFDWLIFILYAISLSLSLDGLVTAEGTKLKFSEKIVKHAEEMKRKSMQIRIPKEALRLVNGVPKLFTTNLRYKVIILALYVRHIFTFHS